MKLLALTVALVFAEAVLGTQLRIGPIFPDFILLGVIAYSRKDLTGALLFGFFGGLLQDLVYGSGFLGLNSLTKVLIGYASATYFEHFGLGSLANTLSVFVLSLGYGTIVGLLKYLFGNSISTFPWLTMTIAYALLNTAALLLWLFIQQAVRGRTGMSIIGRPKTLGSDSLSLN